MPAQHLIPTNQFSGRSNSSTDNALISFITDVQTTWNHGKVTSALTFNIKGYFDFVSHRRLLSKLQRNISCWNISNGPTVSCQTGKQQYAYVDGKCGDMLPVQNGIPQGSPVSPILASFYSLELLEKFAITPTPNPGITTTPSPPSPTNIIMYVDDGKIYISSNSLYPNITIL